MLLQDPALVIVFFSAYDSGLLPVQYVVFSSTELRWLTKGSNVVPFSLIVLVYTVAASFSNGK